ncbi:MAG: hypothetical protein IJX62_07365 [Clostridia bacterium]|nr:hypothetical protein [Clostridia bacterium]
MKKRVLLILAFTATVLALLLALSPLLVGWFGMTDNPTGELGVAEGNGLRLFLSMLVCWPLAGAAALLGGVCSVFALRGKPQGVEKWAARISLILDVLIALPVLLTVIVVLLG